jgi:adenine-specific DNA-methyltransferase
MSTNYHSAYWAHSLTLEGPPGTIESLSQSLTSARVDLNPHQVDAALFAIQSPLSRGVLLADEVGLGKTIEAGLVIAQRWAERRRHILLIVPATLRKQWQQELADKFQIPVRILEASTYRALTVKGEANPFMNHDSLLLCSYQFAAAKAADIGVVPWDLVVIDEAHRLRNVYKGTSKVAQAIKGSLADRRKLLLTATPLQNSLLELYGLVSLIDDYVFGDPANFREQFVRGINETRRNENLRSRLQPLCRRTLRKQVLEYVRFTKRVPITQRFVPSDAEQRLYDEVSTYLQREKLFALPSGQRMLLTMVLRKLLASSTYAIAGTLHRMVERLEEVERKAADDLLDEEDFEAIGEVADEWNESTAEEETSTPPVELESLRAELEELRRYASAADAIAHNSKGDALLLALTLALNKAESLGAARKAVIFTESRRTQNYLARLLAEHGYSDQVVLINGDNSDPDSRAIYEKWLNRHRGSDRISGSRTADIKAALVEEFQECGTILIATESAAEGVNLQFCSLVVNYDLPWNPQRIEQRIGRCHRYGQRHDVVVVNFLNDRNAADQRVFHLLAEKFRLFEGVFGASDEILGAVESGVDIERRIMDVYQTCRTPEAIAAAFDRLQADLEVQIGETIKATRRAVLENFDEDVQKRLKGIKDDADRMLEGQQALLWQLTRHELSNRAKFDEAAKCFEFPDENRSYFLSWPIADEKDGVFFHPRHQLAAPLVTAAQERALPPCHLKFDYRPPPKHVALEPYIGRSGWLELARLRISLRHSEEHLVISARLDNGESLLPEIAAKLFALHGREEPLRSVEPPSLERERSKAIDLLVSEVRRRHDETLRAEEFKLEQWAEEAKAGLERELKELDREIRETRRTSRLASALADKLESQRRIKDLEGRRNRKRRELFDQQDTIEARRDELIVDIERQLDLAVSVTQVFIVQFTIKDLRGL